MTSPWLLVMDHVVRFRAIVDGLLLGSLLTLPRLLDPNVETDSLLLCSLLALARRCVDIGGQLWTELGGTHDTSSCFGSPAKFSSFSWLPAETERFNPFTAFSLNFLINFI